MLGRLLTPLVNRFDLSPRPDATFDSVEDRETTSAENFARDVMVEVMRNSVESLKEVDTLEGKIQVMGEIHRIMLEEASTKDVFRELDGYLLLINILAVLHPLLEQDEDSSTQLGECARVAFTLLGESLHDHPANNRYFEEHVGYDSLGEALIPIVNDARTVDQVFGFLLSIACRNFAFSNVFTTLRSHDNMDLSDYVSENWTLKNANFYVLLVTLLPKVPCGDTFLPRAADALTESLLLASHRNKALLSSTQLFRPLFDRFLQSGVPNVKLLKRLVEIGVETKDVRYLFQHVIQSDGTLDTDILEIIRSGMKAKWPAHFSVEGLAAVQFTDKNVKGLPSMGLTFMIWLYVERLPRGSSQTIFKVASKSRVLLNLSVSCDGFLELRSSENPKTTTFKHAKVAKARWTHVVLVHYPHRASNPTIRVFIDGTLVESRQWAYPRTDSIVQALTYVIGDADSSSGMSWSFASSYLLSLPLSDDTPLIIQHLGPRYAAHFQTRDLYRLLTYEASTSLNIFISSLLTRRANAGLDPKAVASNSTNGSSTMHILMNGIGVAEESFLFSVSTHGYRCDDDGPESEGNVVAYIYNGITSAKTLVDRSRLELVGDIVPVTLDCLDTSLWKIGGTAVTLRIVELASTPHELSRALGIFANGARASWQMSEDMESFHAFEILAHLLRSKSQLINLTAFETLYEFLGLNFRNPDRSVIVNTVAYRAIALDFGIWAFARPEIQQMHLEHFATLLKASKHHSFNAKQCIAKFGVIRKMIFVLQTNWYTPDMIVPFVSALKCVAHACFSPEDTIKPLVSFLAANLHEDSSQVPSPRSVVSHLDKAHVKDKAERVLEALVSILSADNRLARFAGVLPVPRVCLLLLGDRPSSAVAVQVLTIIGLSLKTSSSFTRKFELVSGWTMLKATLPFAWNVEVQHVAFDILLGHVGESNELRTAQRTPSIACPFIVPAILAALERGLLLVAQDSLDEEATVAESSVESLLEDLLELQSSSPSFRQVFKSQQTTAALIDAYSNFVSKGPSVQGNGRNYIRILEKLNHFVMALTLDNVMSNSQRQEVLAIFQKAEKILNSEPLDGHSELATAERRHNRISLFSHASVQVLSERAYQKTTTKIRDWRKNIIASEKKRLRRTAMDLREHRRQMEECTDWRNTLYDDRGIWATERILRSWFLDETEGPYRVRKKLERKLDALPLSVGRDRTRAITEPDNDDQSFIQVELVVPPWAEGYEFHPADGEYMPILPGDLADCLTTDDQWMDELPDDKLRRVRRELEDGDVIEAVCTVTRIVGVDSSPGLLLLGRNHLYMLDGLVESTDGEVIDARDATQDLFAVPGSILELDGKHNVQKWTYDQLASFSRRTCLFRDVALELYFKDNRSLLIVFPDKKRRQDISDKLASSAAARIPPASRSPLVLHRTPLLGRATPSRVLTGSGDELASAQRKWQAREISNFSYICILNQISGRTPGDATQYPVFPWILADYTSETLDLQSPSTFRDLSCPMGALSEARREAARQRYDNLRSVGETPFHYGTHFSSSMIVCHFLIRLEPFTHMFKTLQGGDWDLPDRLFVDVARAYHSASQDVRGDVRELIPEFFTCPEFLLNLASLDFGVQVNTGERIHDVKLPPWARGDPLLFITEHRKALESDFVSENLPSWIDLIWGYKQRDVDSLNVFHPFSYEGSIDLDKITDELQRKATVGIIHNFGQTPRKLFDRPHPSRLMHGPTTLPLGTQFGIVEDIHLLVQSSHPVTEISERVAFLSVDMTSERVIACPDQLLCIPSFPHEQIAWGFVDQSLKLLVDGKVVHVVEAVSCTCVAFVDSNRFVTGSDDYMVRFWDLNRRDGRTSISNTQLLRAHHAKVLCIATSRSWSTVVSGSEDGTAVIWDLNRALYVRSIDHKTNDARSDERVHVRLVVINESTGYIATCSERKLCLHTINAYLIAELDLMSASPLDGRITSLAFHEREYARLGLLATGTDSGTIFLRTWTAANTPPRERAQWKFFTLRKLRCREGVDGKSSPVTALEFLGESLLHGEENGRVSSWDLPD